MTEATNQLTDIYGEFNYNFLFCRKLKRKVTKKYSVVIETIAEGLGHNAGDLALNRNSISNHRGKKETIRYESEL